MGIKFGVTVGFFGIICLMLYIDKSGLMLPTLLATLTHEFGHLLALLLLKHKPQKVILKVGAVLIVGNFNLTPLGELFLNLAGPFINLILFLTFWYACHPYNIPFITNFALINLVLGIFNLLPVTGLDGGSILYLLLSKKLNHNTLNLTCLLLSLSAAVFILFFGVKVFINTKTNPSLILLGLYLILSILISKKQKNYCNIY